MKTAILDQSRHLFDKIFQCVWHRKIYHFIAGGILLLTVITLEAPSFRVFCLVWLVTFWALSKRISTSVLGLFLVNVLSGSTFTTLGTGVIFVVGDGAAAIVGSAFGATQWPWRTDKTVLGSLSFLGCALVAMAALVNSTASCPPGDLLLVAVLPSLVGCLAEALPLTLLRDIRDFTPDDNLLIILSSGAVLHQLVKLCHIEATL
ncbi:Cytidylyltransferase family protein [Candidatus Methylomirabilis lanthanidiphila]|uniref:Cytidylyltransferase family protein n=1 Tax=Candidatus Methylomirabilis lanthanidiphila TaxID=2211376 RepID=A0A564ZFW1_9BACT|nr:hypothetical protein [Candidatus Methylomirabilis lanthanidiphila]VUZ84209.1 Cytidylyltransferase family protein [Candidatus Methylomirabilis lanthanidiphila]